MVEILSNKVSEMDIGDWINLGNLMVLACTLLVLVFTLCYNAYGVHLQAKASDFSSYLLLTDRLSKAWRAYGDARASSSSLSEQASSEREDFEFSELMNVLEMACHLYNEKIPGRTTREMLCDHLKEVLPEIFGNPAAREMIADAFSGPDTFFHIRRFARNHQIGGVPQQ
jgi:hypothetical protein